jgi:pSer/pThr/pTyr-binding forkhead associated (FHA) protein
LDGRSRSHRARQFGDEHEGLELESRDQSSYPWGVPGGLTPSPVVPQTSPFLSFQGRFSLDELTLDRALCPISTVVICSRCDKENASHFTFCEACGQRLVSLETLTPPPAALGAARVSSSRPSQRPLAPDLDLTPRPGAVRNSRVPEPAPVTTLPPVAAIPAPAIIRYRLVPVAADGSEDASFTLGDATTDIGRSEGDVIIADDYVSPRHARITLRGGVYFLRDLGSTNGIFVRIPFASKTGEDAAPEQPLADQDLFLVGQQVLQFEALKHVHEGFGALSENGTLLFGTPTSALYARITQRTVEGVVRDVFHVRKAEMVIGRESGDIVFTDDPFLSRRHAAVRVYGLDSGKANEPTFGLADLGSSNGTFVKVRDEVPLHRGIQFRIGQQLLRFDTEP